MQIDNLEKHDEIKLKDQLRLALFNSEQRGYITDMLEQLALNNIDSFYVHVKEPSDRAKTNMKLSQVNRYINTKYGKKLLGYQGSKDDKNRRMLYELHTSKIKYFSYFYTINNKSELFIKVVNGKLFKDNL